MQHLLTNKATHVPDIPMPFPDSDLQDPALKQGLIELAMKFLTQEIGEEKLSQLTTEFFTQHKIPANAQEAREFLQMLTGYLSASCSFPESPNKLQTSPNNFQEKFVKRLPKLPVPSLSEILMGQRLMSKKGFETKEVAWLQDNLRTWGYEINDQQGKYRGVFGPQTEQAIRHFQKMAGLQVDGVVGPQTLNALLTRKAVSAPEGIGVKKNAVIHSLHPKIVESFPHIEAVWKQFDGPKPVITSGNDSHHVKNSKHYSNRAIDLRGNNVSDAKLRQMGQELQRRLGPDYRVLVELFPELPSNDHIHVQYEGK